MGIEVQNMHLKHSKISFEVQRFTFGGCFETKMIFEKYSKGSRPYSGLISVYNILMRIDENQ